MSLPVPSGLVSHAAGRATTLVWAIKFTRQDGYVIGFTEHDRDQTVAGQLYLATPGFNVESLVLSAGFAVDNTEGKLIADDTYITLEDILAGRWNGAKFELFMYNWADPSQGRDIRMRGTIGVIRPGAIEHTIEFHSLRRRFRQSIVPISQPTCRNRLGDAKCGVNLATAGRTVTGTLTSVSSQQVVRDSFRAEAAGFFEAGEIVFTSGNALNLRFKVRAHAADGTITLDFPCIPALNVGDSYTMTAGCLLRRDEDCVAKFSNGHRFNGEPDTPGQDRVVSGT